MGHPDLINNFQINSNTRIIIGQFIRQLIYCVVCENTVCSLHSFSCLSCLSVTWTEIADRQTITYADKQTDFI